MTAADIAKIIDEEHDAGRETLEAFVARRFPGEQVSTLGVALQILLELGEAGLCTELNGPEE